LTKLPSESWDPALALDSVGGDEEFLSELAGIFSAACPALLKSLEDAIAAGDLLSAADTAHLIWGAARTLSATGVKQTALAVEVMARRNETDGIIGACSELREEAGRLLAALAVFRKGRSAPPGPQGSQKK
jgi:HPt (histidine-containing phosphotransfer) domain-containing protein